MTYGTQCPTKLKPCVWCRALPVQSLTPHSSVEIVNDHVLMVFDDHPDVENLHVVFYCVCFAVVDATERIEAFVLVRSDADGVFAEVFTRKRSGRL
jgi:hypothetical protein